MRASSARLERFFGELPGLIDHVMVTSGAPYGDQLDAHREQLRTTLPIGRVVAPPISPRSPSTS
jgi:hypothetical protein